MAGGRPIELTEEIQEKAWKYANGGWKKHGHAIPSVVGMCNILNRGKSTIYDWAARGDNQFSDILSTIKQNQELTLMNGGLTGKLNSNIVKLALGKHGYTDKRENENKNVEMTHEQWLETLK